MSSVDDQRWRWCEQDHAIVSVESGRAYLASEETASSA